MSSVLQLLRMAFWMRPLQRGLVVFAALAALLAFAIPTVGARPDQPWLAPLLSVAMGFVLVAPLLSCGVTLRILSARRTIALLPHSRGRLLAGTLATTVLAGLLVALFFWISQRSTPPQYRPGGELYGMLFVQTFAFATQLAIGLFIASRSPKWALVVLLALWVPGLVLRATNAHDIPQLLSGPVGLAMTAATWVVFGAWFLKARAIGPTSWRAGSGADAGGGSRALDLPPDSREEALQRWLLGGLSPMRASLYGLAGAAVLVAAQLILGRDSPPRTVSAMIFATLSLGAIAASGIAMSIGRRSRGLWLTGARDRAALYAWCEMLMLRYFAHVALPLAMVGLILWGLLPARSALPGYFLLAMPVLWGLAMCWLGLAQSRGSVWVELSLGVASAFTWFFGFALALFSDSDRPRWGALALLLLLTVASRQLAHWRWRRNDWPRAHAPDPMG